MNNDTIYILDTNVLVYDPQALLNFAKTHVGLPLIVIEELDRLKTEGSLRGSNAREVIRQLDLLRERGDLKEGVRLDNGGILQVLFSPEEAFLPQELAAESADNQILLTARSMKNAGLDVRLVSKDLNMRVKADVLDLPAIDYNKDAVSHEELYKGWVNVPVSAHDLNRVTPESIHELLAHISLVPNEFIVLQSRHNIHTYRLFRYLGQKFKEVEAPTLSFPLEARNPQQLMALDLLFDPAVPLVTLIGPAGTGKTFLTLLAGIEQVIFKDEYDKILISRPVIPLGPDIGYLPGDIREKLLSWMQPIYDNMEFILHSTQTGRMKARAAGIYAGEEQRYRKGKKGRREERLLTVDSLIDSGKISLEAITYMRGRSIPYQFILIDEVQNLTPHEVKTLISRVGAGSKIILAGDPYQIDSPYLDFSGNGLVVASNKFKGQELFGTVYLETSERSQLSKLATQLM